MKNKRINTINWIGFVLTAACFIYVFVIYLIMFTAAPTSFAWRMYVGQGVNYIGKIFVCIAVFVVFLAMLYSVPAYFYYKADGRMPGREKVLGRLIVIAAALNLILTSVFWFMQGNIFDGNAGNAESTVYRIADLLVGLANFGGVWMLVFYSPRYDTIVELKKKRNKI